jgi:hypothetical protein
MKTALITFATLAAMATSAVAQDVCMSAQEMQSSLIDWYGERPVTGPSNDNSRLWVSDATGSWTLVRTLADGNACVTAQGSNWNTNTNADEMLAEIQARTEG